MRRNAFAAILMLENMELAWKPIVMDCVLVIKVKNVVIVNREILQAEIIFILMHVSLNYF
jgi:hypothetical protein